jgi:hypothetical protein
MLRWKWKLADLSSLGEILREWRGCPHATADGDKPSKITDTVHSAAMTTSNT